MHLAEWARARPRFAVALAIGLAAIATSACGAHPAATTATTTTVSPSSSTTSTTAVASTTTASATPTCATSNLGVAASVSGAAAGTTTETVTLTNNGTTTCELDGYPTVVFYGSSAAGGAGAGPKLDLSVIEGGSASGPVTIDSGATATFDLVFYQVPIDGIGCVSVASATVEPPGSTESLELPLEIQACGGSVTVDAIGAPDATAAPSTTTTTVSPSGAQGSS